jgi:hypothetical protein
MFHVLRVEYTTFDDSGISPPFIGGMKHHSCKWNIPLVLGGIFHSFWVEYSTRFWWNTPLKAMVELVHLYKLVEIFHP